MPDTALLKISPNTNNSRRSGLLSKAVKGAGLLVALSTLNGCLMVAPYWNQAYDDHTQPVRLQAFTTDKTKSVTFECSKAYHGGLYPNGSGGVWSTVHVQNPAAQEIHSADIANKSHGAGKSKVLPESCWRKDPANNIWYTAVRAGQTASSKFRTLSKAGLECVGTEVGKSRNWWGWYNKSCHQKNGSGDITYAIFYAYN